MRPFDGNSASLRQARVSVGLVFLVTGTAAGTWFSRIPAVKERLDLSPGELGVALTALNGAAFLALPLAGALVARSGSRRLLGASLLVFAAALPAIALAPGFAALTVAVAVFAAANSGVDAAMNAQGAYVEQRYGRPLLSGMHGLFSVGVVAGALGGVAAAAAGVTLVAHLALAAGVVAVVGAASALRMLDEPRDAGAAPLLALPTTALTVPSVIALCGDVAADIASSWSAVYVATVVGTGEEAAAASVAFFAGAMAAGRFAGDRLVARLGTVRLLRACGAVAAAGMALALLVPRLATAAVGLAALGAALGPVFPVVFSHVARRHQANSGAAIAAVSSVAYLGATVSPPAVGGLAELFSLRAAFLLVPALALAMTALATRLGGRP